MTNLQFKTDSSHLQMNNIIYLDGNLFAQVKGVVRRTYKSFSESEVSEQNSQRTQDASFLSYKSLNSNATYLLVLHPSQPVQELKVRSIIILISFNVKIVIEDFLFPFAPVICCHTEMVQLEKKQ